MNKIYKWGTVVVAERSATDRKEAWSGNTYTRRSWQFNRRNQRHTEPQRVVLVRAEEGHAPTQPAPLSVIYTRDLARRDHVILEDVDGTEYRVSPLLSLLTS